MLDPQALAARYLTGNESLRQLATSIGRSEYWLRCTLHKHLLSQQYRRLIINGLLKRISHTHGDERKYSLHVLRRVKPHAYGKLVLTLNKRTQPKRCSSCSKPIQARLSSGLWIWSCEHCGKSGIKRMVLR